MYLPGLGVRRLRSVSSLGQLSCYPNQSGSMYCGQKKHHAFWTPVTTICKCHPLLLTSDTRLPGLYFAAVGIDFYYYHSWY